DKAAAQRDGLERRQVAARHASEQAAQNVRSLEETIADLTARAAEVATEQLQLDERVARAAGGADPTAERERVAGRRAALEGARAKAQREEREAETALAKAQSALDGSQRLVEAVRRAASQAREKVEEALREAGFTDGAEARAAALPLAQQVA